MIRLVEDIKLKEDWNSKSTHPMQAWEWGEAREKMGIKVIRVGEFKDERLTDAYQMTLHPIPRLPFKIGYIPRSNNPTTEVLEFFRIYGKNNNLIYIKFEPNSKYGLTVNPRLKKSSAPLFPQWTQVINLAPDESSLLKNMKPKTRYNIKLAQKKGVTVREMTTDEGFEIFIKLYFETCRRQHYAGHNYNYHKTIFDELKNNISHILVAFYNKTPIAAYHLFKFNNALYYPYGGSSDQYREVMGANLLMWEAMRFGKESACKTFDLWGSLDPNYSTDNIWAGFTRFKSGFGSIFSKMMGSYDLVILPVLYGPLVLAQRIRERFLGGQFISFLSSLSSRFNSVAKF